MADGSQADSILEVMNSASSYSLPSELPRSTHCIFELESEIFKSTEVEYKPFLFSIPNCNSDAYKPHLFSIGPINYGKGFSSAESCKKKYVNQLLTRTSSNFKTTLRECLVSVKNIENQVRLCYSIDINQSSDDFVTVMVIDGLFLIELFLRHAKLVDTYVEDPLLQYSSRSSLVHDLVLLENQLPMMVLDCLSNIQAVKNLLNGQYISKLAVKFFDELFMRPRLQQEGVVLERRCLGFNGKHLLELLGRTFYPPPLKSIHHRDWSLKIIPIMKKLKQDGVKIKRGSLECGSLNITFCDGVLIIPPMTIRRNTETLFRNIIAYELCAEEMTYMTSYVFIMGCLLDSVKDVEILCSKGIIINHGLGSNDQIYDFLKKLSLELQVFPFYYSQLCDEVKAWCMSQPQVLKKCVRLLGFKKL
ncbi:Protein of unknown function DUF247 [Macleaya cordata]|uniref:Uncharacterized protein n=1 Tax=Macleaya cordata TaxID=56857 RepID=A0A200PWB7_MACCD|nr:Protein of unknown function DUF247 [Macleaya cordata]